MSTSGPQPDPDDRMPRPPGGARRAGGPGPVGGRPRRSPLATTLLVLAALAALVSLGARVWTDKLWFDELGYSSVWRTEVLAKVLTFLAGGLLTAALVSSGLLLAYRHRPVYAPSTPEQDSLDRYRSALDPFRRLAFWLVPAVLGVFAGATAMGQWRLPLLWLNRRPFGTRDPQFGHDVGFYVFTLPWLQFLVSFLTMALVLSLLASALTHYVYGGLSLQGAGSRTTPFTRVHLSVLLAGLVLLRALSFWLSRYALTTKPGSRFDGIGYTDQHAVLPGRAVLAVAALLCALLFVSTILTRTWRLPLVGVALLVVTTVVIGGLYPSLVQSFQVKPSERTKEAPFLERNIAATRAAYGLSAVSSTQYQPSTDVSRDRLREDAGTIPGIRIVDPAVVSPTFRQLQGRVNYYQFPDALDVDRYTVDGKRTDTVVAVRELDLAGVPAAQRSWVNDHSVYTHGFGVVAAYGNKRTADGEPQLFERDIPPVGAMGRYEPRVYFGESSPRYSIVGGAANANRELDYPDSATGGERRTTYQGQGGVGVGSVARRLAYAVKYREYNILLSDVVDTGSRLLDHRHPRERVQRVAPWLTLDGNVYPVVTRGRVQWVVDGYTTSSRYPYSQLASLGDATTDSLTARSRNVQPSAAGRVNYIRNSVKATVDAYDGSVRLYAWDDKDPVLRAWSSAFGNTVRPLSMLDGDLMSHLRYPEDLFKVQRELLARYHVTNANAFYQGNDFWQVPTDPTRGGNKSTMPPYYLSIAMPGQPAPTFQLTSTFIPAGNRNNLAAFVAVDADAGATTGRRRAGYGQIRVLEMPRNTTIRGPGQFQNDIDSSNANTPGFNQTLSQFLSLNRAQQSTVIPGNLLTLPVGKGLLYVEPIYVQARGETSYPLQRIVVTGFGNRLAWSATLDGALDQLFDGSSGASAGDAGSGGSTSTPSPSPSPGSGTPSPSPTTPGTTSADPRVAAVQKAYQESQDALRRGDWQAYGQAQQRLGDAIRELAQGGATSGVVTATPSPATTG